jgi:hypothetical protein
VASVAEPVHFCAAPAPAKSSRSTGSGSATLSVADFIEKTEIIFTLTYLWQIIVNFFFSVKKYMISDWVLATDSGLKFWKICLVNPAPPEF